jgi:hypothetical protein
MGFSLVVTFGQNVSQPYSVASAAVNQMRLLSRATLRTGYVATSTRADERVVTPLSDSFNIYDHMHFPYAASLSPPIRTDSLLLVHLLLK